MVDLSAPPVAVRTIAPLPPGEAAESLLAVHAVLAAELPPGPVAIYEAGGGSTSYLSPELVERARVTVVDIDPVQLANNAYAHQRVLGDVQVHRPEPQSFDLVVCYNVIEHLPDVEAAFARFGEALKPGGLLLIGAPHPRSLSGLVTKHSPHWFHVWFYRAIRGHAKAGEPGEPPFPTYYHPLVDPAKLERHAAAHGFQVVYERAYESPRYPEMRARRPKLGAIVDAATNLVSAALRADVRRGDYHLILRKG